MKYRRFAVNGDYSFGNGQYDYVEGTEAIASAIKSRILLFYGEWWEDLGVGIPMFQSFLGQYNNSSLINSLKMFLEKRILELKEVKTVNEVRVEIDKESRKLNIEIDCTSKSGELVEVGVAV